MLCAHELWLHYSAVPVLRGASLTVRAGERVAVLGGNASGKSSLLRALCGLHLPEAGEVAFLGREVTRLSAQRRARMGLAFCPAERPLFPEMSVRENLEVALFDVPSHQRSMRFAEALGLFPWLKARLSQRAGALSGGEQKLVALARALLRRPALLLLDEPSLGLAPGAVRSLGATLLRLNQCGLTLLFTEQNVSLALGLAQRAYVLERGVLEPLEEENDEISRDCVAGSAPPPSQTG